MRYSRLVMVLTLLLAVCAAVGDWPWFNGPDRTGLAAPAKRLTRWPAGGPKVLWTVKLGAGFGGPAVRDGKLYILDRIRRSKDNLRCLDLKSGKEVWSFKYSAPGKFGHGGSRHTPTVDEKHVFVVGPMGDFHCVDAKGNKVWAKHLLNDFGGKRPNWAVAQSPLLYKDWVIVAPLGKKAGVIACEKATGRIVWQSKALGSMQYVSPVTTTIGGVEQVVILSGAKEQTRIDGLDIRNGKVLWTYGDWKCRIPIPNVTCIGDGRMFITGGYGAGSAMFRVTRNNDGAFEAKTLFKTNKCGSQVHQPLVHEGHLYANSNSNTRHDGLLCMDFDGNLKWKTGKSPNFERGNLILADGLIYIIDGKTGFLHLVKPNPTRYQEISKVKMLGGREIWSPMALSGGRLVIRDQSQMKCLYVGAK